MGEKVLITYASRMGSTAEIAGAIGDRLVHHGFAVDVRPVELAPDARRYRAVIVGSAVYIGRWEKTAVAYLKHQAPDLAERPTWLFQSGPCDPQADLAHAPVQRTVNRLCFQIGTEPPTTFGGRLDHSKAKGLLARWVSNGDLAGDFRDWNQITSWADAIADQLKSTRTLVSA